MAEVHVKTSYFEVHNPGVSPSSPSGGQVIAQLKDTTGKVITSAGQVPGCSVVHVNPA